jgi:hypothetical protein
MYEYAVAHTVVVDWRRSWPETKDKCSPKEVMKNNEIYVYMSLKD